MITGSRLYNPNTEKSLQRAALWNTRFKARDAHSMNVWWGAPTAYLRTGSWDGKTRGEARQRNESYKPEHTATQPEGYIHLPKEGKGQANSTKHGRFTNIYCKTPSAISGIFNANDVQKLVVLFVYRRLVVTELAVILSAICNLLTMKRASSMAHPPLNKV